MDFYYLPLIIFIGLFAGFILMWKTPTLKKKNHRQKNNICFSVIIPARNEAHNLPNILNDLKEQSLAPFETIVVNDQSDDDTLNILKNFNVKIVDIKEKPKGWAGKTFACQKGAEFSTTDNLIFIDADVRLHRDALHALMCSYHENKGVLSVWPYHKVNLLYESLALFFNLIAFYSTKAGLPFAKKTVGLYGPVILFDKAVFQQTGGFENVKNSVLEDFELGLFLDSKNIKSTSFGGGEFIRFRMYPKGLKEMFHGFSKNISSGALKVSFMMKLIIFLFISAFCAIPIFIFENGSSAAFILGIVYYIAGAVLLFIKGRKIGSFHFLSFALFPVPLLFFLLVFAYSFILKLFIRKALWKGRRVDI